MVACRLFGSETKHSLRSGRASQLSMTEIRECDIPIMSRMAGEEAYSSSHPYSSIGCAVENEQASTRP